MKIALFSNINIQRLEAEVNSFISRRKIEDIKFSDRSDGLAVMVLYEE